MLILSLKAGETVHVGVDVVITNTSDRHISLGFEAPGETRILRGALTVKKEKENQPLQENACIPPASP